MCPSGATANFFFREGEAAPLRRVKLRSGDAVVFPANSATAIYHGIDSLEEDAPSWWPHPQFARVCVQYRQQF